MKTTSEEKGASSCRNKADQSRWRWFRDCVLVADGSWFRQSNHGFQQQQDGREHAAAK